MAPSVPTHNENHNYHDPSNTCIHDMDHAHANTFNPIVVPKATSLPEVIVKPDGQNNKNVGHNNGFGGESLLVKVCMSSE
jgi:hypothetical protein